MTQRILTMMVSGLLVMVVTTQPAAAALLPAAPTLVQPQHHSAVDTHSPVITGLAPSGMRIAVYIDNTFNGYATAVSMENGVQSFKYTPFLPLTVGEHTVMTRAENVDKNVRSKKSRMTHITVEPAYPAPTVLGTVVNEEATWQQPWITGVAPSGSTVEVWIDGTFNGSTTASVDDTGTGSFAYKPFLALTHGKHAVSAVASTTRTDGTTRKSQQSEEVVITVVAPVAVQNNSDSATEEAALETVEDTSNVSILDTAASKSAQSDSEKPTTSNANTGEMIAPTPENVTPVPSTNEEVNGEANSSNALSVSDSTSIATANDATAADSDEGPSSTRTIIGWVLLIIAAVIIVVQMRQRRNTPTSGELQFGPSKPSGGVASSAPVQPTSPTATQAQLELHVSKENKNIQLVEKKVEPQSVMQPAAQDVVLPATPPAAAQTAAQPVGTLQQPHVVQPTKQKTSSSDSPQHTTPS